jgi:C4-dicarboxylate-specific signal transduction histidine kinase
MDTTTNRKRELSVRTEVHDRDAIVVSVQDSGPGIDPERLDGIFGVFVSTKEHGSGLGPTICRMISSSMAVNFQRRRMARAGCYSNSFCLSMAR